MSLEFGISIASIGIAGTSLAIGTALALRGRKDSKEAHELTKKYHGFEARQRIDERISTFEFKQMKQDVIKEYFIIKKEKNKAKAILSRSNVAKPTLALQHGFNIVCSWYEEEDWVDKKNFDKVYAGNIVNSWNLLKDDIFYIRDKSEAEDFCKHFQTIAEMYEKQGIKAPLYDLWH